MGSLIFNGHDLGLVCLYGDPDITVSRSVVNYAESDNRNGSIVLGRKLGNSSVTVSICIWGNERERRDKLSALLAWLAVDESKPLILPDTPERYYMAIPDGDLQLARGFGGEVGQLTFTITDPIAYGAEKSIRVPYGGSVSFVVGGTAPTLPWFNRTLERPDQTTKQWGLRLDDGDVFVFDFGTTTNRYIQADFEKRVSYVDDVLKLPTLNSDWFELTPGEHTITNHIGSGNDLKINWRERWY